MEKEALISLIDQIIQNKYESTQIELKSSKEGNSKKFYDTLSSFSNTTGGIILFGIDEKNNFNVCGVNDVTVQQKIIQELCACMEPVVRPVITVAEYSTNVFVVSAEIPEMEAIDKPCYYKPLGLYKGSFTRVGESDELMTELEISQFLDYKRNNRPELDTFDNVTESNLNKIKLNSYLLKETQGKTNFSNLEEDTIKEMLGVTKNGKVTLSSLLCFGIYPQEINPSLTINCVKVKGTQYINENNLETRFVDNIRCSGTIEQMYLDAMAFVKNNMQISTVIDKNGNRKDDYDYPIIALREAITNALIHRDYSSFARNIPISIEMYDNRIEITNPGGLLGNYSVEDLGKKYLPIRNPFLARMCETSLSTENRHSGILTIIDSLKINQQLNPLFENSKGYFKVVFFKEKITDENHKNISNEIISFCKTPRDKETLAEHFGYSSKRSTYFFNTFVKELIEKEILCYTIPEKPASKYQKIVIKSI